MSTAVSEALGPKKTFPTAINELFTQVLTNRQDTSRVGEIRRSIDTTWLLKICNLLWERCNELEAELNSLKLGHEEVVSELHSNDSAESAADLIAKRGPGRPKNS